MLLSLRNWPQLRVRPGQVAWPLASLRLPFSCPDRYTSAQLTLPPVLTSGTSVRHVSDPLNTLYGPKCLHPPFLMGLSCTHPRRSRPVPEPHPAMPSLLQSLQPRAGRFYHAHDSPILLSVKTAWSVTSSLPATHTTAHPRAGGDTLLVPRGMAAPVTVDKLSFYGQSHVSARNLPHRSSLPPHILSLAQTFFQNPRPRRALSLSPGSLTDLTDPKQPLFLPQPPPAALSIFGCSVLPGT